MNIKPEKTPNPLVQVYKSGGASCPELTQWLHNARFMPDKNRACEQALRWAAALGHTDLCAQLLPHIDPQNTPRRGLMIAAENGHEETFKLFLDKCSFHDIVADDCLALRRAVKSGNTRIVEMLLPYAQSGHTKGLSMAQLSSIEHGHDELFDLLNKNRPLSVERAGQFLGPAVLHARPSIIQKCVDTLGSEPITSSLHHTLRSAALMCVHKGGSSGLTMMVERAQSSWGSEHPSLQKFKAQLPELLIAAARTRNAAMFQELVQHHGAVPNTARLNHMLSQFSGARDQTTRNFIVEQYALFESTLLHQQLSEQMPVVTSRSSRKM